MEAVLALRLSLSLSKRQVLGLYAAYAPFGGNTVGLDAAAWRYFGRDAAQLSWAETATLAVLPNAPALVHPGRNPELLLAKRNRLLERLRERGVIDALSLDLAKREPLPPAPEPLPMLAPHLVARIAAERGALRFRAGDASPWVRTTLVKSVQVRASGDRRSPPAPARRERRLRMPPRWWSTSRPARCSPTSATTGRRERRTAASTWTSCPRGAAPAAC